MSEENATTVDLSKPPAEDMVRVTFLPGADGGVPLRHPALWAHGKPMSFLDVAEHFGIFLDHACGGVCACTTCHLWMKEGGKGISGG